MYEVVDVVLDTGGVQGDAVVQFQNMDVPVGPLSTLLNAFIINSLVISVCDLYVKEEKEAPIYRSANVPGGADRNRKLEEKFRNRIPRLR